MTWRTDREATRLAQELFPGSPMVKRNGDQYLVLDTPFGRLELLRLPGGTRFLAAAENPPQPLEVEPGGLPPEVFEHLRQHALAPWRIVEAPTGTITEALRRLADGEPAVGERAEGEPAHGESAEGGQLWSPFLCRMEAGGEVVGEPRLQVVDTLAGLVRSRRARSPLPVLIGVQGSGKHFLAAAAAAAAGLRPIELPLGRLLIDRVLSTSLELFLQTMLTAGACLGETDLLVVSDAEVLHVLRLCDRRYVWGELARLPRVLVLSLDRPACVDCYPVICPLVRSGAEVGTLLEAHFPRVRFEDAVKGMVLKADHLRESGMVPGRLLDLVRIACSLAANVAESDEVRLTPDDMALALRLTGTAWRTSNDSAGEGEP